uniref:Uncharacterized protein n=1 Tax=Arundo donax TaxID=35708 RepID=A0A0A9B3C7_ARUDO
MKYNNEYFRIQANILFSIIKYEMFCIYGEYYFTRYLSMIM